MEYEIKTRSSSILLGVSSAGTWTPPVAHAIPILWIEAYETFRCDDPEEWVGACFPPRSDDYYYTCGIEQPTFVYHNWQPHFTVHTLPEQAYAVFVHKGNAKHIPQTYHTIWQQFDDDGLRLKPGLPELEIVKKTFFGKEYTDQYEMEIWLPLAVTK